MCNSFTEVNKEFSKHT